MSKKECKISYYGLRNVSDEFIEEAQNTITENKSAKRLLRVRLLLFVASFVLLFYTVTVFAYTGLGTSIIDIFTSRTEPGSDFSESGYDLSIEVEKTPMYLLKGEVQEVSGIIVRQFESYKLIDSWYPGSWQKDFSSSAAAREYVGLESLRLLDWNLEEQSTKLMVTGNDIGELLFLQLETYYQVGDIRLQAYSHIYTEDYDQEITYGSKTTEDIVFTESFYTTDNKLQCHIITSTALESGILMIDGYLVEDSILYNLHIAYLDKDTKEAEDLLYQWANLF